MSRPILTTDQDFDVATADATGGTSKPTERFEGKKTLQFIGTFGGTTSYQIEGSMDGTAWVAVGSAVTAVGIIETDTPWTFMRVLTNVHNAADVSVLFGAFDVLGGN